MVKTDATGRTFPGWKDIPEDLIPAADNTYDLGSLSKRWAALYVILALVTSLVIGGSIALTNFDNTLIINDSTEIQGDLDVDGYVNASDWTDVSITESQISDFGTYVGNNSDGWWINFSMFQADTYLTDSGVFSFNFYDDGSEFFFNLTSIGDAINFITDNSKMVLYNAPSAGNDWKVFQIFSKEAQDVTEFVISKAGDELTAYFVRSLSIVGNGTAISTPWNCTTFANFIDCKTDLTGPDFYVLDDVEINGSLWVGDGNFNVADDGNVTGNFFFGNGSQLTGITMTESDPFWTGNETNVAFKNEANVFTAGQSLTNQNITAINCIIFDSGGKICSGV